MKIVKLFCFILFFSYCSKPVDEITPYVICGHVYETESKIPIFNAKVSLSTCNLDFDQNYVYTDSSGHFKIIDNGCRTREYSLKIEKGGYKEELINGLDNFTSFFEECYDQEIYLEKL
jgi:hypothetical protein